MDLCCKVISLLFNMLSRLVVTFLPRSKCLLISWLQSPSAVILEPRKIKSATVSTVSPSICHEVISITSDMQMTPPLWQKVKRNKKPLDESERGEWKSWLKAQHSENKDHGIWSHHLMGNRWGNSGNSVRLYFWGLQNHCRLWLQPWN